MAFTFEIPTPDGPKSITVEAGSTAYIVGANGGGKTRLAAHIEEQFKLAAQRVAGHRALILNPEVAKISERAALLALQTGYAKEGASLAHREGSRWRGEPTVSLLNDFDPLIQALFADQANTALRTHKSARANSGVIPDQTKFERLQEIWERVLPHRSLNISGDNITVLLTDEDGEYPAKHLSDGERATFYLIGQALVAAPDSLLIFDEPELHLHRAILGPLWDELEAARPDCAFVVISHDLEFVASRTGNKYVARSYKPSTGWVLEEVPLDSGFSEELTTLILGTRKPVLFVEGAESSLDLAIYRSCYPGWTVIPKGGCEQVIHAVTTLRGNPALTRIHCVGIVDADDFSDQDIAYLSERGVAVLPLAEIENVLIHPSVVEAILLGEGHRGNDLDAKLNCIMDALFAHASEPDNRGCAILRYCRRRIDRALKKVDLSDAKNVSDLAESYIRATSELDIGSLAALAEHNLDAAIEERDAGLLLRWYDNKGVMGIASNAKASRLSSFEQWVVRSLRNDSEPLLRNAILKLLPQIH